MNKNIWIFHHYASSPNLSGLTRPYEFASKLKKEKVNITIFSASYLHYSNENLINNSQLYIEKKYCGVPFVYVKTRPSIKNGFNRILNMIDFYMNLIKTEKKYLKTHNKPDIIIASSPHPLTMIAGIKIAKKLNIPCITEVRDFWPEVFFENNVIKEKGIIGKILLKIENWIYKKSDSIIFLKEGDYNYLLEKKWSTKQGGSVDLKKCYYLNNGVDIEEFQHQKTTNTLIDDDLDSEKFKIIYTGAIRPVNNIDTIIDAAKSLANIPMIEILIYGNGSELERLKKRVENESITNVKLKGRIEKKYIPYILSKSSVNLLNYSQTKYNWSRGNSSNKLFEYMASGKPVISTVRMGYNPIEKYNCGITLKQSDADSLAKGIKYLYNLEEKDFNRFCNNAKIGAEEFDYNSLSIKLLKIIKESI